jgi:hypothetical protein
MLTDSRDAILVLAEAIHVIRTAGSDQVLNQASVMSNDNQLKIVTSLASTAQLQQIFEHCSHVLDLKVCYSFKHPISKDYLRRIQISSRFIQRQNRTVSAKHFSQCNSDQNRSQHLKRSFLCESEKAVIYLLSSAATIAHFNLNAIDGHHHTVIIGFALVSSHNWTRPKTNLH